jgi:hypothetical protein
MLIWFNRQNETRGEIQDRGRNIRGSSINTVIHCPRGALHRRRYI